MSNADSYLGNFISYDKDLVIWTTGDRTETHRRKFGNRREPVGGNKCPEIFLHLPSVLIHLVDAHWTVYCLHMS